MQKEYTMQKLIPLIFVLFACQNALAQNTVLHDYELNNQVQAAKWIPDHDLAPLLFTHQGLKMQITGGDPYMHGPAEDYPARTPVWITFRLRSDTGGMGRLYYFHHGASERKDIHFTVSANRWQTISLPLPPLGAHTFLRFDPPGTPHAFLRSDAPKNLGSCILASLVVSARTILPPPVLPPPTLPHFHSRSLQVRAGMLTLQQAHHQYGAFRIYIHGRLMAVGLNHPTIGYLWHGKEVFFSINHNGIAVATYSMGAVYVRAVATDPQGATWQFYQTFSPGPGDTIQASCQVRVNQNRQLLYLPLLVMFPGFGSFGSKKQQALFAGLEYLNASDRSSSQADMRGAQAHRELPISEKLTLPLMAVAAQNRVLSLRWQVEKHLAALFDSPDRIYHSGAHLFGLIAPGSTEFSRPPGELLPYQAAPLLAGHTISAQAYIMAATGNSIVPALQQYTTECGLPGLPRSGYNRLTALQLAAQGWLHSPINHFPLFSHAFVPGSTSFVPLPSPEAPTEMEYLATQLPKEPAAAQLNQEAHAALAQLLPARLNLPVLFHVPTFAPALLAGHALQAAKELHKQVLQLNDSFAADGHVYYHPQQGAQNLAATNPHPYSNGLQAETTLTMLRDASYCGEPDLIHAALKRLKLLNQYYGSVPRGAQTWEVPLHTPDILASAELCHCYVLGYHLTGSKKLLQQAEYWAWTGLPFVYLRSPVDKPVGAYATIAVYGATHWRAPSWIGLPVQWCGMVYAHALRLLYRCDHNPIWKQLADGITLSGLQQTWPANSKLAGLLPDSYLLGVQHRNYPAINPGTVFSGVPGLYHLIPLYRMKVCRRAGLILHAAGRIQVLHDDSRHLLFRVECWPLTPCDLLITGLKNKPALQINGKPVQANVVNERFLKQTGQLAFQVDSSAVVTVNK